MLRDYELMYILSPDLADDAVAGVVERINGLITARGGEVKDVNMWGRRRLAYPIKRHLEGSYVLANVAMEPATVRELESSLRINEDVLRHIVVRPE